MSAAPEDVHVGEEEEEEEEVQETREEEVKDIGRPRPAKTLPWRRWAAGAGGRHSSHAGGRERCY